MRLSFILDKEYYAKFHDDEILNLINPWVAVYGINFYNLRTSPNKAGRDEVSVELLSYQGESC